MFRFKLVCPLTVALLSISCSPAFAQSARPGERIVKFSPGTSEPQAKKSLSKQGAKHIERLAKTTTYRAVFEETSAHTSALALDASADVENVDLNRVIKLSAAEMPEMTANPDILWHLRNPAGTGDINILQAWDYGYGDGVKVAVIDSGINLQHPEFAGRIWTNADEVAGDGIDNDRDGAVDNVSGTNVITNNGAVNDDNGHGTFVSGMIAATDDGAGSIGVAPHAQIIPIKALNDKGIGSEFDIADAIYYAVYDGASVINMSLTANGYSRTLKDAVDYAEAFGVTIVAAAGNEGVDNDVKPSYPANFQTDNVISVGSSNINDMPSSFSNRGDKTVSLSAPGENVASTWSENFVPVYTVGSGTSYAGPLVAGTVALMYQNAPFLSTAAISHIIQEGVDRKPQFIGVNSSGGRLNAGKTLSLLPADRTAPAVAKLKGPSSSRIKKGVVKFTWKATKDETTRNLSYELFIDGSLQKLVTSSSSKKTLAVSLRFKNGYKGHWWVRVTDYAGNQSYSKVRVLNVR